MLQASGCLSASDVAIRCSVRHSPLATDRKFNEPEDMLCTMRTSQEQSISKLQNMSKIRSFGGHESSARKKAEQLGPELILITVANNMNGISSCCSGELGNPIQLSQRFASFGSGHGDSKCRSPHASFRDSGKRESAVREITIPVSDIMVVDMYGHGNSHRTNITTLSKGFFEFTLENRNGQEILLAFLRANLPEERVMEDIRLKRSSSGLSSRSFDVEAFTATRMAERIQHETLSEKLKRKVGRVVSSFEEISSVITECACGCGNNTTVSPAPLQHTEKRDSPPRDLQYDYGIPPSVEIAPTLTPVGRRPEFDDEAFDKRREMLKNLSVEMSEPEFESISIED